MKKLSLPIFCLFLAALPAVAQSGDASPSSSTDPHAIGRFLDGLMANFYDDQVQAALGSFTYEYTDLPTPFTRWLQDELVQGAAATKRLRLFNRARRRAWIRLSRKSTPTFSTPIRWAPYWRVDISTRATKCW